MNDRPPVLGNRYEVGGLLGRGGMAEVHLGRDTRLGRSVAIKLLRTDLARDPTFQARFRREAQSAAALNHPAIVAVYDTGEESVVESGGAVVNLPYIVMEHIEGRTLRDVLAEGHHLDVDAALDIITGVLTALEYSHRIGIVHRDIKPANVMLTPVGDVKVMDFGIARAMADASSTMTQTQAVIGTAQYLSPEQARGEQVDTRSDLYSAGCLLYELLTGRPPFVADSPVAVAYQHVQKEPTPPSHLVDGIPESVDRIVLHSLGKGREDRYQTASDFRADVEAARGGRQVYATVPVMQGSNATTQYVPAVDATGTRLAPAGGGLLAGGDTMGGGSGGPYDPYAQNDEYGGRRQQRETQPSNRGFIIGALVAVVVLALVGYLVLHSLNNKGNGGGAGGGTATGSISMPNVVGQDKDTAKAALVKDKFLDANITLEKGSSDTAPKGQVINQNPTESTSVVPATQKVTLTYSTGPASTPVSVPDVTGETLTQAKKDIRTANLTVGSVTTETSTTVAAGHVTRTDPAANSSVSTGDSVDIFYVAATKLYVIPKVAGQDEAQARATLTNAGISFVISRVDNGPDDAGLAIGTNPPEGTKVKRHQQITLIIGAQSTGGNTSPPPTSPDTSSPSPSPSSSG